MEENQKGNTDINITLPNDVIDAMAVKCKTVYKKRSEYIKDLIVLDLKQEELL